MELLCVLTVEAMRGETTGVTNDKSKHRSITERVRESVRSESDSALGQGQFPSSDIV